MNNKDLVNKAIQSTDGRTRSVTAYLSGRLKDTSPEISDLLWEITEQTYSIDTDYELKSREEAIINALKHLNNR